MANSDNFSVSTNPMERYLGDNRREHWNPTKNNLGAYSVSDECQSGPVDFHGSAFVGYRQAQPSETSSAISGHQASDSIWYSTSAETSTVYSTERSPSAKNVHDLANCSRLNVCKHCGKDCRIASDLT